MENEFTPKAAKSKKAVIGAEPHAEPKEPSKLWEITAPGSNDPQLVEAPTIEDAIRLFNGGRTAFARKNLKIVEA